MLLGCPPASGLVAPLDVSGRCPASLLEITPAWNRRGAGQHASHAATWSPGDFGSVHQYDLEVGPRADPESGQLQRRHHAAAVLDDDQLKGLRMLGRTHNLLRTEPGRLRFAYPTRAPCMPTVAHASRSTPARRWVKNFDEIGQSVLDEHEPLVMTTGLLEQNNQVLARAPESPVVLLVRSLSDEGDYPAHSHRGPCAPSFEVGSDVSITSPIARCPPRRIRNTTSGIPLDAKVSRIFSS